MNFLICWIFIYGIIGVTFVNGFDSGKLKLFLIQFKINLAFYSAYKTYKIFKSFGSSF